MISHYLDLKYQIESLNATLGGQTCHVQKSYATLKTVSLQLRVPGKSHQLVIGKGNHFEGLGLVEKAPVSAIRVRDRLLEYLRKNLVSSQLVGVELDEKDRVIHIRYFKARCEQSLMLFYSGRQTYLVHAKPQSGNLESPGGVSEVFCSWKKGVHLVEKSQVASLFDEVGRCDVDKSLNREAKHFEIDKIWKKEEGESSFETSGEGRKWKKKLDRKILLITQDLENTRKCSELQSWAASLNEEQGIPDGKSKHFGIKFNWGYGKSFFEKREMIYTRSKRLKRGQQILIKRLEDAMRLKNNPQTYHSMMANKLGKGNIEIQWSQSRNIVKKETKEVQGSVEFHQFENIKYGLGLSALGNDQLRSQHAKKSYWWFHTESGTSPHAIIFNESVEEQSMKRASWLIFKELVKKQPDLREIDIIYTQVKNLKSVKGQAGKVLYKKEKRRRFYLDDFQEFVENL